MRVLGVDPGSSCTGYGVLDGDREPRIVTSGVVRAGKGPLAERLARIHAGISEVLRDQRPEAVAVEEVFHARNARSALVLGHARGVVLLAAGQAGVPVHEYPARRVKQTITGNGNADKTQVRALLVRCLGSAPEQLDASDALAVALCHLRWAAAPGMQEVRG